MRLLALPAEMNSTATSTKSYTGQQSDAACSSAMPNPAGRNNTGGSYETASVKVEARFAPLPHQGSDIPKPSAPESQPMTKNPLLGESATAAPIAPIDYAEADEARAEILHFLNFARATFGTKRDPSGTLQGGSDGAHDVFSFALRGAFRSFSMPSRNLIEQKHNVTALKELIMVLKVYKRRLVREEDEEAREDAEFVLMESEGCVEKWKVAMCL